MAISASAIRTLRRLHLYVGVFTAPALLFFALTGALQTIGLHEPIRGSNYRPPHWIEVLAQIHKKQTAVLPPPRRAVRPAGPPTDAARPDGSGERPTADRPPKPERNPAPLKAFFLLVSLGLFASTISGIWMSYVYDRNKRLITALLVLGVVLPIVLVFV